jgi:uncharacterized membrane protein
MNPALFDLASSPWWSEQAAGWFGAVLGSAAGLVGALLGVALGLLAPRGKGKTAVLALQIGGGAVGAALLAAGLAALALGQPYHVWYPLLLVGVITDAVLLGLLPVTFGAYRAAEARRLAASHLRRS